jgi:hypothetical protein
MEKSYVFMQWAISMEISSIILRGKGVVKIICIKAMEAKNFGEKKKIK